MDRQPIRQFRGVIPPPETGMGATVDDIDEGPDAEPRYLTVCGDCYGVVYDVARHLAYGHQRGC